MEKRKRPPKMTAGEWAQREENQRLVRERIAERREIERRMEEEASHTGSGDK